ncbi:hypothetical protein ACSBR1_035044 [Camellia fascicularis]
MRLAPRFYILLFRNANTSSLPLSLSLSLSLSHTHTHGINHHKTSPHRSRSCMSQIATAAIQIVPSQPQGSIAMHDAAGWISMMDHLQQLCG